MNKKRKIESISDYIDAAKPKDDGPYDDFLFIEPISMLPISPLGMLICIGSAIIIAAGIIIILIPQ